MSGRLMIEACDDAGVPVPARIEVRSLMDGSPQWPTTEHLRDDIVEAWGEERSFACTGPASLEVPLGSYLVRVSRGLETRAWQQHVEVGPDRATAVRARVERWTDMSSKGWFSGDMHSHRSPEELALELLADDLAVASSIAAHIDLDGVTGSARLDTMQARSRGGTVGDQPDITHLSSATDVEVERIAGGSGAIIGLGLSRSLAIEAGAWEPFDTIIADQIHARNGHVDGDKVFWPNVPILAALGSLDSVGIVGNHFGRTWTHRDIDTAGGFAPADPPESPRAMVDWILELYYALLGCGFRLPLSGGSGAGVMPNPVGACRVYAHLDEPLGLRAWLAAVGRGQTFATNGPMLELELDGAGPGETLERDGLGRRRARLRVFAGHPILEAGLLADGEPIAQWHASREDATVVELDAEIDPSRMGWIAGLAFEQADARDAIRFAHTSPIWTGNPPGASIASRSHAVVGRWLDWTEQLMRQAAPVSRGGIESAQWSLARARQVLAAHQASSRRDG